MKSPLTSARAGAFAALVCFFLLALALVAYYAFRLAQRILP